MALLEQDTVRVFRTRPEAKLPVRAHKTDAGMDLFYCPDDGKGTTLFSQHTKLFQTGLKFEVPEGYMLEIKNKSSVASKRQLVVGACVVNDPYKDGLDNNPSTDFLRPVR